MPLNRNEHGYHQGIAESVEPGSLYLYRLDEAKERPDPASRFQPLGVHKPSEVVDLQAFGWSDAGWNGLPLEEYIIYELHVGTYTPEGTFDAIIPHLDSLRELGVTAIELMPISQFPGGRNWGYDGVHPYAVQHTYGGPEGLQRFVDACHHRGLAVVLDVVYNHLGPEGNYLGDFGPYFTDRYRTPWGQAINFDGPHSDEVVNFFIENALFWVRGFHVDALRLDAIHGIVDRNAQPFLQQLAGSIHQFARDVNRRVYFIAESNLNDVRFVLPRESGGYGLDAQWSDDFHHSLHALLTTERAGYYQDFGRVEHLVKATREGFVYSGQYSAYRRRRHGNSSCAVPARQFVVFAQNHDQVGNRPLGERLSSLVSFEALKLAAGIVLLSPFIPLLFMGEEYGERAPFQYFISHSDPGAIEAVRRGRLEAFEAFEWRAEWRAKWKDRLPDPQDESTFSRSKLDPALCEKEPYSTLRQFYKALIALRRSLPALATLSKENLEVQSDEEAQVFLMRRSTKTPHDPSDVLIAANFADAPASVALPTGTWRKILDSSDRRWLGKGSSEPEMGPERPNAGEGPTLLLPPLSLLALEAGGNSGTGGRS